MLLMGASRWHGAVAILHGYASELAFWGVADSLSVLHDRACIPHS